MLVKINQNTVLMRVTDLIDEGLLNFGDLLGDNHVELLVDRMKANEAKARRNSLKKVISNLNTRARDQMPTTFGFLRSFCDDVLEDRRHPRLKQLVNQFPGSWKDMAVGIHSFLQRYQHYSPNIYYDLQWSGNMAQDTYGETVYSRETEHCAIWLNKRKITNHFIFRKVFLHELCHAEVFRNWGGEIQPHGTKWVSCVARLRTRFPYLPPIYPNW